MPDLSFLSNQELTTKDKLVLLTAHTQDTSNPSDIALLLGLGVASVKQSLAKTAAPVSVETETAGIKEVQRAVIEVCQLHTPSMRSSDWKHVAKVAADLHSTGADSAEVKRRARNLEKRFHIWPTPGSLDKYWAQLADHPRPFSPRSVLR